jgi:hypothetical protein
MNEVKANGKAATESKKSKAEKPATKPTEADKTVKTADTTPADTTPADKPKAAPKSASQSSISHFSSVSTPAYKSGWDSIFGAPIAANNSTSKATNREYFPDNFNISDEDIDKELRKILYKAFQKQARKQGYSLSKVKKLADFEYSLDCSLIEK